MDVRRVQMNTEYSQHQKLGLESVIILAEAKSYKESCQALGGAALSGPNELKYVIMMPLHLDRSRKPWKFSDSSRGYKETTNICTRTPFF